jgi:hypothetical protein
LQDSVEKLGNVFSVSPGFYYLCSVLQVFNEGKVKLYIPKDGKDYAIAYAQKQEEIPLYFKTTENGNYTLKIYLEGLEMGYLHLIDTKIGAEVDLLQTPSYTFEATSSDDAVRFKLVFKP